MRDVVRFARTGCARQRRCDRVRLVVAVLFFPVFLQRVFGVIPAGPVPPIRKVATFVIPALSGDLVVLDVAHISDCTPRGVARIGGLALRPLALSIVAGFPAGQGRAGLSGCSFG